MLNSNRDTEYSPFIYILRPYCNFVNTSSVVLIIDNLHWSIDPHISPYFLLSGFKCVVNTLLLVNQFVMRPIRFLQNPLFISGLKKGIKGQY